MKLRMIPPGEVNKKLRIITASEVKEADDLWGQKKKGKKLGKTYNKLLLNIVEGLWVLEKGKKTVCRKDINKLFNDELKPKDFKRVSLEIDKLFGNF